MTMSEGLWGTEFEVKSNEKEIINKISNPKKVEKDIDVTKILKSKKVSTEDKISIITENVNKILGQYKENTIVIYTEEELNSYIDKAITAKVISVDTETNNSLDPITCKLMGLCLYVPGEKQAYIPVNHIDYKTGQRLENQLTEQQIHDALSRINNIDIIMHNASFDIKVIQCTCNIELHVTWDTLIAANLIDENEEAGLKKQYINHIDSSQEKYSIEHLFEKEKYEIFSPELFALYAATDAYMTYKLYQYQKDILEQEDMSKVYKLFKDIEMPLVKVVKDMELRGIEIDQEYAKRLSAKYTKNINKYQQLIEEELQRLKPQIDAWRKTEDANHHEVKDGKQQKSKNEKLQEDINLESPIQLSILLYDVLKSPVIDKDHPRGTSDKIVAQMPFEICRLINARKKLLKLLRDFIDLLPTKVNIDNKIHCNFKQCGTDTGRFACAEPNLQNIPSHAKEVRMMFKASTEYNSVECKNNCYKVSKLDEIQVNNTWIKSKDVKIGDELITSTNEIDVINDIKEDNLYYYLYVKGKEVML